MARPGKERPEALGLTCSHHPAIEPIAAAWDALVPRDLPHLRSGFLRAATKGGMIHAPDHLMVHRDGGPVAVALAYTVLIDPAKGASPRLRAWIERIRRRFPGFYRYRTRVCGSPIGNGESGVHFSPGLDHTTRRQAFACIVREVERTAGLNQSLFFKDFTDEAVADHASALEPMGFFRVDPGPGTRLDLRWTTFDDFVGALRSRYRYQLRKDLEAGEGLELTLLDSFADLAPGVNALHQNVVARATSTLQVADARFFAALSAFDQAHLLVARLRPGSQIVGVNVLLFGDACMHNAFIGLDYTENDRHRVYFNLFERSLRLAIERGCKVAYFGQTSYEFKARLGAAPFRLTAYMKHPLWPVHSMLRSAKDKMFPNGDATGPTDVFRAGPEEKG